MWRKFIFSVCIAAVLVSTAQAALFLWHGGTGDGLWETPGNWLVIDSVWTWPNEEAVADPDINDKYTNTDTLRIDIIGGVVTRSSPLAIQGAADGSTTAVLTLEGSSLTVNGRLATSTDPNMLGRGEINILGGSTVTIIGDGNDLTIADDNGNWGMLNIVDSTVVISDDLRTDDGESHVSISGSSVLDCDDFAISQNENSLSFVDISGTTIITIVDDFDLSNGESIVTVGGDATVTFGDDLYVPDDDNAVATLTITDNAVFNVGDDVNIGDNPGSVGHMIITGNATVDMPDEVYIADAAGAEGIMDVNGTAILTIGDDLQAGDDGLGTCNVGEDATVDIVDDLIVGNNEDSEGHMTISGNATVSIGDELYIGNNATATGTLNVNGNATLNVPDDIDVGDEGPGTCNISGNATVNVEDTFKISENGGEGHLTIGGTATVNVGDDIEPSCSPGGLGTCDIGENATVSLGDDFELGVDPNGEGHLTVSDNASVTCDDLRVGVSLESITSVTINGGKTIVRDDVIMGSGDGDPSIGQSRVFINGGLLQAEGLDIQIVDSQIILTGGQLRINSASVSEDDMWQLIDEGTIVADVDGFLVATDGAYTILSAPIVTAWGPTPADGTVGVSATPLITTYVSDDVPKAVSDPGQTVSTVDVSDSVTITDLNVELDIRMRGGNNADLDVYLESPDGKQVELFTDVGLGKGDDFTNTILDDEASTSIKDGSGPYTGRFKPEGRLRDFDGRNTEGTWQLRITDDWVEGKATLNSWQMVVESPNLLSWTPGANAVSQDVYFSDKFDDVKDRAGAALLGSLAGDAGSIEGELLDWDTTYYWCVDSIDPNDNVELGEIWSFATAPSNVAADVRIATGDDDVEEKLAEAANGDLDMTSSDLEIPYQYFPLDDPQRVGLRFVNVGIPAGAEITEAYIELTTDGEAPRDNGTELVNVLIDAQLTGNAEPLVDEPFNITQRTFTDTVVPWAIDPWTTAGAKNRTPDISALVEQLISLEDWASGNAMVFTIQDDPCNPSEGVRAAESYDGSAANAPLLRILGVTETAQKPFPADGAVDVPQDTIVRWEPGFSTVTRDVYFGTTNPPARVGGTTTGISYDPGELTLSTTYYLKVDEIEADGTKHPGPVWSFTTMIGEATDPDPADGATDVASDAILSWTAGSNAVSHDVYLGTTSPPDFVGNQAETSYDPGGLSLGSTFYWQIDEIDDDGTRHIGDIWSFSTLSGQASQPDPADGALLEQTSALLTWTAGPSAASHDVYISDNLDDVTGGAEAAFVGNYSGTSLSVSGLRPGGTYYWRVDAVEADPSVVHVGDVWSLSVLTNKAHEPNPADGAVDVALDAQLSWSAGLDSLLHYVYFGDDLETVTNATDALPLPLLSYDPGPLEPGKTYYWRIDEFSPDGVITGDVWSFTTFTPAP